MNLEKLESLSTELGTLLTERKLLFTSAESCTGGWVGQSVTGVPGSSKWYGTGFITYSNTAKIKVLGVNKETLKNFGAVSEEVVSEMVEGALSLSNSQLGVAISGIAGPGGGTKERPVGTVCIAWLIEGEKVNSTTKLFSGNRNEVRYATVECALINAIRLIKEN